MPDTSTRLFEMLEAVNFASRHDDAVVLLRDGEVLIARPVDRREVAGSSSQSEGNLRPGAGREL